MACYEFRLADHVGPTIDLTKDPAMDLVRGVPSAIEVMVTPGQVGTMAFFCWGDDEARPPRTFTELSNGKPYEGGGIVTLVVAGTDILGVRVRWENVK